MVIFGLILCIFGFLLLHMYYIDLQRSSTIKNETANRNFSVEKLVSDSVLKTLIAESLEDGTKNISKSDCKDFQEQISFLENSINHTMEESKSKCLVDSLFRPPDKIVDSDWKIILGSYNHYGDKNWKEFLVATNASFFIRIIVNRMSEVIDVSRKFKKRKKAPSQGDFHPSSDYVISITTNLWVFSHESKFRLREMILEHDIDGTDSENLFFFASPRLLVHNKVKLRGKVSIMYNFDEFGLNVTYISRSSLVVAKRLFNRVST